MVLERISIERAKKRLLGESLGPGDDVHIKERIPLKVFHPSVQPLIEMLKMDPKAANGLRSTPDKST